MENEDEKEIESCVVKLKLLYQDKAHPGFWALLHDKNWKNGSIITCRAKNYCLINVYF